MGGNYMVSSIMDVVKLNMILEKASAKVAVAEIIDEIMSAPATSTNGRSLL
jgi:hypothetical protein